MSNFYKPLPSDDEILGLLPDVATQPAKTWLNVEGGSDRFQRDIAGTYIIEEDNKVDYQLAIDIERLESIYGSTLGPFADIKVTYTKHPVGASNTAWTSVGFDSFNPYELNFNYNSMGETTEKVWQINVGVQKRVSGNIVEIASASIQIKFIPKFPQPQPIYSPFVAKIEAINGNEITINNSWTEFKDSLHGDTREEVKDPTSQQRLWNISYKINNKRDLNTYLHFGGDMLLLTTNSKTDKETFEELPYSTIYKLYEPLPDDVQEKDNVYVVREVLPQLTEAVELFSYEQQDEDVVVLRVPDSSQVESTVTTISDVPKNYNELVTSNGSLRDQIIDKYISGSEQPASLNIDYTTYENFVNFSSAQKRLENFKHKVQLIEGYTSKSSSLAVVTEGSSSARVYANKIREVKNNFDGYESYLYNISSSYVSSSMGEFQTTSWPKTGSGTYADPYTPVSSSHADFTSWYGSLPNKTGQLYSASLYDTANQNRLVNLLPMHVYEDGRNNKFFDFIDMAGHHFDELWSYTKELSTITDRQNDLSKGFSKDLVFNLAKSLGWDVEDGTALLDLSRIGFGQKISGSGDYSLYTSGSLSSPAEGDISKEITKRLIANMPYLLKSKGTIGSLKGIINCYGIPSTILRVREYGGAENSKQRDQFEISRRFTKALGFRSSQYVISAWTDDGTTSRKPETVELRFRAVTGSDQVLVQKDAQWALKLKDNGSSDNYGTVSFMLSGSDGYKEVSSSLLPVFDGEYHSVMLRKQKINTELFPKSGFETSSLFNPPFISGGSNSAANGTIKIVSSSNVAHTGTKSLEHSNTHATYPSYTYFYRNPGTAYSTMTASVADVSIGETYTFSAYAKVSSSHVDSVGSIALFELNNDESVINFKEEQYYPNADGGIKGSNNVGLNETEWKQLTVTKTIKYPNTTKLGVQFTNRGNNKTIFWDDISLQKHAPNTDTLIDGFNYDLYVKKYDAGLDRIVQSSFARLAVSGSGNAVSQSYNAAWTGSGDLFIGGNTTTPFSAAKLSGSMMEFRLWSEVLDERFFDIHVQNPKSYVGNSVSSSYVNLMRRYSFDDDTTLATNASIRDVKSNQATTQTGSAQGWGGVNAFEATIDKTKTVIPNHGPNRRLANKIRIENNALSGSGASLSRTDRFDVSANDLAPIDSPKLGVYFSPTDVINEDIVSSFANLDFNQYIGDPRDEYEYEYSQLGDIAETYFQKYSGNNNFWDYMHVIKYYDQNIFKQLKRVIPARAKTHLGTLIESNILQRPKSPVLKNRPSRENLHYESKINISAVTADGYGAEDSRSVVRSEGDYLNYFGNITGSRSSDIFRASSLYNLNAKNDNFSDNMLYLHATASIGGPNKVYSEPTGAMAVNGRPSQYNFEYNFTYANGADHDNSSVLTTQKNLNFYTAKSRKSTDIDTGYENITAWNRLFYEGVKQTKETTLDGDLPIITTLTAPTVVLPYDGGISKLTVDDKGKAKLKP